MIINRYYFIKQNPTHSVSFLVPTTCQEGILGVPHRLNGSWLILEPHGSQSMGHLILHNTQYYKATVTSAFLIGSIYTCTCTRDFLVSTIFRMVHAIPTSPFIQWNDFCTCSTYFFMVHVYVYTATRMHTCAYA